MENDELGDDRSSVQRLHYLEEQFGKVSGGFSLRKLAKALGVGPTTIHFHFEGGVGAAFSAVAQQALAGVTRPFKPKQAR